ncbi:hypothetical protein BD413DRAFT_480546 [Trametes elegans]|nr:hypothetical protein BD413DRAFT_480546 [Trametes elegans]
MLRVSLDDLPPEITQEILLHLPQWYILKFGQTSRKNYAICQPALYREIVLTYETFPLFEEKIMQNAPCLRWVQVLTLGRPMYPAMAPEPVSGWSVLRDSSSLILLAFPNLRALDTMDHAPMRGWAGFSHVLNSLPSSMSELRGKVAFVGDLSAWPLDCIFPSYQFLQLSFSIEHTDAELIPDYCGVPSSLSVNFPCLVRLSLFFSCFPDNLIAFLTDSHFTALETFSLVFEEFGTPSSELTLEESHAFAAFLARHAPTLRNLFLPKCSIDGGAAEELSQLPLSLRHLETCQCSTLILAKCAALSVGLQTLFISHCDHGLEVDLEPIPQICPLRGIRVLDLPDPVQYPHVLGLLPHLVPNMQNLRLHTGSDVPSVSRAAFSITIDGLCTDERALSALSVRGSTSGRPSRTSAAARTSCRGADGCPKSPSCQARVHQSAPRRTALSGVTSREPPCGCSTPISFL